METQDRKNIKVAAAVLAAVIVFGVIAALVFQDAESWRELLEQHLKSARGTPWAFPLIIALYVFGGFVLFPVTVLNLACAMVFGLMGIVYALVGVVMQATVLFLLGRVLKKKHGQKFLNHPKMQKVDKGLNNAGVMGVVGIHLVPFPPFSIVNLAAGLTSIPFATYLAGTFLVMLPGAIARGVVGDSLMQVFLKPNTETYLYLGAGLLLWAGFIAATHMTAKKFQSAS
jgi:phospholipase D1/2